MPDTIKGRSAGPIAVAAPVMCAIMLFAACGAGEQREAGRDADLPAAAPPTVDLEALAYNIVNRTAGVREGDIVGIVGHPRDLEFLENIAVRVRAAGAFPLVTINTARMNRRMFDDVPERFDAQPDRWFRAISEIADVWIGVEPPDPPGQLAHVPPARMQARWQAGAEAREVQRERRLRVVEVGNNLYPAAWRAERFGISVDELARIFWEGVAEDPDRLAVIGNRLRDILVRGSTLRITHPNGTDLTVRIDGRPVFVSSGTVASEDEAPPSGLRFAWLPAGEVYLVPVLGSAAGRVVVDRQPFRDEELRGVVLDFADGRLVGVDAESDLTGFREVYDAALAGKEILSFIDFGTNPGVPASNVHVWVAAGIVTIGIGQNEWAGGDIDTNFAQSFHLPGTTVAVDDRVIVDRGVLVDIL